MIIAGKRALQLQDDVIIENKKVEVVQNFKHLGVYLDNNLGFNRFHRKLVY